MTRLEILDFFNEIERRFPVNSWYVGEVQVWPFLRVQLAYRLIDHFEKLSKPPLNKKTSKTPINKLVAKLYPHYKTAKQFWHYYRNIKRVDFLFVGADTHRMNYKGEFVNKFFSPLLHEIKKNHYSFYNLEYGLPKNYPENLPLKNKTSFINKLFELFNALVQKGIMQADVNNLRIHLPSFELFEEDINNKIPSAKAVLSLFEKEELIKKAKRWNLKVQYYQTLLRKLNPACIFELCYYDENVMCLNVAARKCQIQTIEIMHGVPVEIHMAYSRWAAIDKEGYDALPNQFWCWSEDFMEVIEKWADKTNTHKPFVGGHPWMEYIQETVKKDNSEKRKKKRILFTMQPLGELLAPWLLDTIKQSGTSYEWWLRLHPRQLHQMNEVEEILKGHQLYDNVNVKEVSALPLPEVLALTDLHITRFSGATVEASMLGIKTILVDAMGAESYPNLVNSGMAIYISPPSPELISKEIQNVFDADQKDKVIKNSVSYKDIMDRYFQAVSRHENT